MSATDPYYLLEQARKKQPNPFKLESVITADEVWGEVKTNLPSLNQHIDQKILDAIIEIRYKYSKKIGIAIKGDRGTGKSHVIHRIWKKISQEGGSVFAYIGPCSNPKRINSHVRFYLADSFSKQDIQGVTQWQKLAVSAIKTLKRTKFESKYQQYIERCDSPNELKDYIIEHHKDTLKDFFDDLVEVILENQPDVDFNFLRAVLFLLLKNKQFSQIALAWIKGEDHSEIKKIGLPEFPLEQQEDKSVWIIQQICKLAEVASFPVILCFDQLDSAGTDNDSGDSPSQTVAKCIDQIYFQCSNIILLCCVISDTWGEIEQMGSGIPDRVGQWSVTAKPPVAEQMIELVKLRLNWFYTNSKLNSSDYPELYPFEESQIRTIASVAAGARSLMQWCAEKFEQIEIEGGKGKSSPPTSLINDDNDKQKEFLAKYNELLNKACIPIKDDDQLAAIIACTMKMIPDGGSANVVITKVDVIHNSSHDLHLAISGYDYIDKREIKIGVRVCETTNGHSFNAVMKRLLNYNQYNITRGCLIRSTPIPRNWKVGNQLKEELEKQKKGEVVVLKKDEIKSLTAIQRIYEQALDYGFSQGEVIQIVKSLRLAADNPLICEILSAPV